MIDRTAQIPRAPLPGRMLSAAGHYWTMTPVALHALRPRPAPPAAPWSVTVDDPKVGRARISGVLHEKSGGDAGALVVIVHGLGGDAGSHYVLAAARAAGASGMSSLRFNLRGADRSGEALYHAGLTADVHAALASAALARYDRIYLVGYSLGGHLALRTATEALDPRVRAVAAICAPVDLLAGVEVIDEPARLVYRRFLLDGLQRHYAAVARRHPVPVSVGAARRIRRVREWDERIVAPWFGFDSADHYYREVSVAPRLPRIALPTLFVAARHDPMVAASTVLPSLERHGAGIDVRWIDHGGHVGFPASAALGLPGPAGIEPQVMAWLARHA